MCIRRTLQSIFFIITIYGGVSFYYFVEALKENRFDIVKPGSVEAFLPLSALMALKQFIFTGTYDMVHPAGLLILIMAVLISIIFKKGFCSTICPVGFVSELISESGLKIKIHKYIFPFFAWIKYALFGFFAYAILYQMSVFDINGFLRSPYNIVADAKMLYFFQHPSMTTIIVLGSLIFLTMLFKNLWCRFLCPYGAMLGLLSMLSPFKVKRDKKSCTSCKACSNACPMDIEIHKKNIVHTPECFGCFECVKNKSNQNCLSVQRVKNYKIMHPFAAAILFSVIGIAVICGFWFSETDNKVYAEYLKNIRQLSH